MIKNLDSVFILNDENLNSVLILVDDKNLNLFFFSVNKGLKSSRQAELICMKR